MVIMNLIQKVIVYSIIMNYDDKYYEIGYTVY